MSPDKDTEWSKVSETSAKLSPGKSGEKRLVGRAYDPLTGEIIEVKLDPEKRYVRNCLTGLIVGTFKPTEREAKLSPGEMQAALAEKAVKAGESGECCLMCGADIETMFVPGWNGNKFCRDCYYPSGKIKLLNAEIDRILNADCAAWDELRGRIASLESALAEETRLKFEYFAKWQQDKRRREQLDVQLAGCSVAALGGTQDPAVKGQYGWSPAYQDVLALRSERDQLAAQVELARETVECPECEGMGVRVYPGTALGHVETCRQCKGQRGFGLEGK